jgi:P27 family predicted phage terminase small subunit
MNTLKSSHKQSFPKPPAHLSKEAGVIWATINRGWHLDESALIVLATGLEAFDRMRQAQEAIKLHGVVIEDRFGQLRSNPATTVERDSRAALLSAFKLLALDLEPIRDKIGRPAGS